jgi:hypothetical protein
MKNHLTTDTILTLAKTAWDLSEEIDRQPLGSPEAFAARWLERRVHARIEAEQMKSRRAA